MNPGLLDELTLRNTIDSFKASLAVTDEHIWKIEWETVEQENFSRWYEVHHFRLTASLFGTILRKKKKARHSTGQISLAYSATKKICINSTERGVQLLLMPMSNTNKVKVIVA